MTLIVMVALTLVWVSVSNAELVAYWPLDEGTGGEIEDTTGNGHNGTFKGDPAWIDGVYGKALEFDGDDHVEVPTMADVNPESITMAMWVYFTDTSGRQDFISRNDDYAISIGGNPQDSKLWAVITTDGDWLDVGGTTQIDADTWHHVAITHDANAKTLTVYLNGEVDGEAAAPAGMQNRNGGALTIGTYENRYLKGKLDDIKIWDEALSEGEIQESMEAAAVEPTGKLSLTWGEIKVSK